MALFYSPKSAKKSPNRTALQRFKIESLDYQGLGVAKVKGKTWFVGNAMPGEVVQAKVIDEKRQFGRAESGAI